MPGIIPHLLVGISFFLIGEYYYKYLSKIEIKKVNHLLLLSVCLIFSLIPDFPLGLYYIFHILSYKILLEYHCFLHQIITPISLIILLILAFLKKTKRTPIWILGMICILFHILMDYFIHEGGLWL